MNVRNAIDSLSELLANESSSSSSTGMISSTLQSALSSSSAVNFSANATLTTSASEPVPLTTIILAGTLITLGMIIAGCLIDRYWVRNHKFWQQEQQAVRRGDYNPVDRNQDEETGNRLVNGR
jgi:hypothetical protein